MVEEDVEGRDGGDALGVERDDDGDEGHVTLVNRSSRPVAILRTGWTAHEVVLDGERKADGRFVFRGTILERSGKLGTPTPVSERHEFSGERGTPRTLVATLVVAPGERLEGAPAGEVQYAVVPEDTEILRIDEVDRPEPPPSLPSMRAGGHPARTRGQAVEAEWRDATSLTFEGSPATEIEATTDRHPWPPPPEGIVTQRGGSLPDIYRYGLWQEDLRHLEVRRIVA